MRAKGIIFSKRWGRDRVAEVLRHEGNQIGLRVEVQADASDEDVGASTEGYMVDTFGFLRVKL